MISLLKYLASLIAANAYRLLRIFPNNDPIMGFMLPFARQDKPWKVALFAFATMFSFDILVGQFGIWTWVTSSVYALLAIAFAHYFQNIKKISLHTYTLGAILGVLLFDIITGPLMSSWLFNIPMELAVIGQIPFTAMHMASAVAYTWALAPLLDPVLAKDLSKTIYEFRTRVLSSIFIFSK